MQNGIGKSTLIEGIAALAAYDDADGGKGYRPVDHSDSIVRSGGLLATALRAALTDIAPLRMSRHGLDTMTLEETGHFRLWREFCLAPAACVAAMLDD